MIDYDKIFSATQQALPALLESEFNVYKNNIFVVRTDNYNLLEVRFICWYIPKVKLSPDYEPASMDSRKIAGVFTFDYDDLQTANFYVTSGKGLQGFIELLSYQINHLLDKLEESNFLLLGYKVDKERTEFSIKNFNK